MNIKKLSYILVSLNVFLVSKALPLSIILIISGIIFTSLVFSNKQLRLVLKIAILVICIFVLKMTFAPLLVPEAAVSLILILSALKLWELETNSDHFNMFLILALAEGTIFILNSSLYMFIIGLIQTAIFFYFILKLRNYDLGLLNFRRILYLTIPALIFSLILFYTFPRFTKGFNSTPGLNSYFSEASSKLNFSKLGPINPSSKIIFRVKGVPPSPQLYWRSLVLRGNHSEDWTIGSPKKVSKDKIINNPNFNYQILLSDDFNEYLPTLEGQSKINTSTEDYNSYEDGSFRLKNILKKGVSYSVSTSTEIINHALSEKPENQATILRAKNKDVIAKEILDNRSFNISASERLNLVLNYFKGKHFEYSLNPPIYNSVEDFIQSGHAGYCSHFAAAFVYMARSVRLPSRIVLGYQGGEFNPYDQSLIIRELDGHAWAEVYISNIGWKRIDPTAIVAPTLITDGAKVFNKKLNPAISFYFFQINKALFEFKNLDNLALWLDALNLHFSDLLTNFNKDSQLEILNQAYKYITSWIGLLLLCFVCPPIIFYMIKFYSRKKIASYEERRYRKFLQVMKRNGYTKSEYETASTFKLRCEQHLEITSKLSTYLSQETEYYINYFYRT